MPVRRSLRILVPGLATLVWLGWTTHAHTTRTDVVTTAGLVDAERSFITRASRSRITMPPVTIPEVSVPVIPPTTAAPTTSTTVVRTTTTTVRRATTTTVARVTSTAAAPAGDCTRHGAKSYGEMQSCWGGLVAQYAWPSTAKVWSVMYCESKGDEWAHNPSGATGLMQIMGGPYDPAQNMAAAWSMSRHGTYWKPWTCR